MTCKTKKYLLGFFENSQSQGGGAMVRKVGRPSSNKAKLITVRLTPKMRYSVELLARVQRRQSITAVVEFAIDRLLHEKNSGLFDSESAYLPDLIWDEDEVVRFVNLCLYRPDLLDYEEGLVWRTIEMNAEYWKDFRVPDYDKIKDSWSAINSTATNTRLEEGN